MKSSTHSIPSGLEPLGERAEHPTLDNKFLYTRTFVIRTPAVELIEEMFSRLNEAGPLNTAENRNGKGGPLREIGARPGDLSILLGEPSVQ